MTLKTNGLDWLAQNAGSGNCFASSGISYRDGDGVLHTGGTKDVVTAFVVAKLVDKTDANIIAGTNYNEFKSINGGVDLAMGDVTEAADRELDGGTYPRYCVSGVTPPPPPPTTDKPVTRPFEVIIKEGVQCGPGSPSVLLDTSEAFAYFKATPLLYVGVMDILVNNLNTDGRNCWAYFIWEMRMWDGTAGTTCPTGTPEVQEICRFVGEISDKKALSIKMLGASENAMIGGSFEIPANLRGTKTICLSLWGNYDKQALIDELAAAGYQEEIPW